jgi:hypothetical protein
MNGLKGFLGQTPFIGSPLNMRGNDISLRGNSNFTFASPSSTEPSIRTVNTNGVRVGIMFPSLGQIGVGNSSDGTIAGIAPTASVYHFTVTAASRMGFCASTGIASISSFFMYGGGAGIIQMGADVNGSAVNQGLKAHNGITGTDIAGANLNIGGGASTGAGRGGSAIIRTFESTQASGATSNSSSSSQRFHASAKYVTLAEATATTICTFSVSTNKFMGCKVEAVVNATDGTDTQALASSLTIAAVNKSGTITATIVQVDGTQAKTDAGAGLTPVTYTVVDAGSGNMGLQCAATSGLTQTVLSCRFVVTAYSGDGSETFLGTSLISPS